LEDRYLSIQSEQFEKYSKSSDWLQKKPALQKHFYFDHVNRLYVSIQRANYFVVEENFRISKLDKFRGILAVSFLSKIFKLRQRFCMLQIFNYPGNNDLLEHFSAMFVICPTYCKKSTRGWNFNNVSTVRAIQSFQILIILQRGLKWNKLPENWKMIQTFKTFI